MKDNFGNNFISFQSLLDFIDGTLDDQHQQEIASYLNKKPIDKAAVEGVKLIYEHKEMSREELEAMVASLNISIPINQTKQATAPRRFRIPYYTSTVIVAYIIITIFLFVPTLVEDRAQNNRQNMEEMVGPFEVAMGTKMCP